MTRFLKLLLLFPIALLTLGLAVSNRQVVTVYFHPFSGGEFPEFQLNLPLYLVLLITLAVGVVVGGVATWFEQGKYRSAARRARAEAKRLTAEIAKLSGRATGSSQKVS
jgi:uncharacterized integral membrane protein